MPLLLLPLNEHHITSHHHQHRHYHPQIAIELNNESKYLYGKLIIYRCMSIRWKDGRTDKRTTERMDGHSVGLSIYLYMPVWQLAHPIIQP